MNGPAKDTSTGSGAPPTNPAVTQAAFVEKAELELKEFTARMERLTAKAEKLTAEAKANTLKGIGELKPKLGLAREKLNAVKAAAGATWLDAKAGAESVWSEVKSLFEKHDSKPAS
jgi:hypothetical protein